MDAPTYPRIEDRITGWFESRSQSTRKQSIKQVISKLHELSNGLFGRGALRKYHAVKAITERGSSSRLNKSQTMMASAAPSSRLNLIKMRHTSSALHDVSPLKQDDDLNNKAISLKKLQQLISPDEPLTVHCLKIRNFEIPPTRTRTRNNKIIRRKVQDESLQKRTQYEMKRSQLYRRRPPQPEQRPSQQGLRDSIIKLMEDNLRIKALGSRSSRLG